MILLRNFDFANKYFDYESKTEGENTSNPKICGWYKYINGLLSGLLVLDNNLYFVYEHNKFLITDNSKVLLQDYSQFEKEFTLVDGENKLVVFLYSLPDSKLNVSPFEYIDDEDFKWGDFIEKVINDPERKKNFRTSMMG